MAGDIYIFVAKEWDHEEKLVLNVGNFRESSTDELAIIIPANPQQPIQQPYVKRTSNP
jgi:hypothetical protein